MPVGDISVKLRVSLAIVALVGLIALRFLTPRPAHAQSLPITIGVDHGTLNAINGLRNEIRVQLEKAVRDLLPDIDKSMEKYIADLDGVISKNLMDGINALQCSTTGVIENAKETTAASLAAIFFPDNSKLEAQGIPHPLLKLDETIRQTRANMKFSTAPRNIQLAYLDLLHFASIVNCQTRIDKLPVLFEVQDQTTRLFWPAMEWKLLVGNPDAPNCSSIADCAQKRRQELQSLIGTDGSPGTADPRDVKQADARAQLKKLPIDPESPSWIARVAKFDHIDIYAYEQVFTRERQIERGVEAARMSRETKAAGLWDGAVDLKEYGKDPQRRTVDVRLHQIETEISAETSIVDYINAIPRTEAILKQLSDARSLAKQAMELDARLSQLYPAFDESAKSYEARALAAHARAVTTVKAHQIFRLGMPMIH